MVPLSSWMSQGLVRGHFEANRRLPRPAPSSSRRLSKPTMSREFTNLWLSDVNGGLTAVNEETFVPMPSQYEGTPIMLPPKRYQVPLQTLHSGPIQRHVKCRSTPTHRRRPLPAVAGLAAESHLDPLQRDAQPHFLPPLCQHGSGVCSVGFVCQVPHPDGPSRQGAQYINPRAHQWRAWAAAGLQDQLCLRQVRGLTPRFPFL